MQAGDTWKIRIGHGRRHRPADATTCGARGCLMWGPGWTSADVPASLVTFLFVDFICWLLLSALQPPPRHRRPCRIRTPTFDHATHTNAAPDPTTTRFRHGSRHRSRRLPHPRPPPCTTPSSPTTPHHPLHHPQSPHQSHPIPVRCRGMWLALLSVPRPQRKKGSLDRIPPTPAPPFTPAPHYTHPSPIPGTSPPSRLFPFCDVYDTLLQ